MTLRSYPPGDHGIVLVAAPALLHAGSRATSLQLPSLSRPSADACGSLPTAVEPTLLPSTFCIVPDRTYTRSQLHPATDIPSPQNPTPPYQYDTTANVWVNKPSSEDASKLRYKVQARRPPTPAPHVSLLQSSRRPVPLNPLPRFHPPARPSTVPRDLSLISARPPAMARVTTSARLLLCLSVFAAAARAHGGGGDDADADADSPKPDLRSRGLVEAKLWCLVVVFLGTLLGGVSPYFMRWNEAFLALGTQFAGGVFLGTALMHFLSDANETFEDLLPDSGYPWAFMLACAGYVVTTLADLVISYVVSRGRTSPGSANDGGGGAAAVRCACSPVMEVADGVGFNALEAHGSDHSVASMLRNASTLGDSILLIAALCFHSVFEGIAIGIAETKADAWKALWTISLHKIFAAIAMGIALLRMIPNRPLLSCFAYAFAFAISSPIGVAIGIVIDATTQGRVADWIFAVSMGLATGIFIYVSINHLLSKGYKPRRPVAVDTPVGRWLAVVLGVAVIAVVMIWDT
ncbi:hypothetical protein HU200_018270 [Digitaria exilis]|uniref:Zinc transporter n=1 Tax=Digitaria exilis TaxID=1010633 RepID=A0A835F5B9_9POAL|nr:hypothetical protein HU200_018270 [Digitaria exilis]